MKLLKFVLTLLFLVSINSFSQEKFKQDDRPQIQKEHQISEIDDIELIDLVEMLEFQGIRINKFKLGKFDKRYKLYIVMDEYLNGQMISSDTIVNTNNTYTYFKSEQPFYDYINQITIITKDIPSENKSQLSIKTYGFTMTGYSIEMKNTEKENSLNWRKYIDTKWELNKKIPLLIYASSWLDEKYGVRRFCGVRYLKENEEGTNELLKYSPNYVKISYVISE
ncbi:DUF5041 domain-containing protein [Polaribacter ponticola]|uniref:DUF5041 domain-containing protein n=1 Tax=Polaribacter ponticola TaxID=2978475 RepID=A0ABT5S6T5_9FLAO|nr:DUF5041 domain-containing protein [Polaribacter sp. MSW5]MDD7913813.1 DUF5041 domain-containing protein [Polaribacter sp. MSW5]